MIGVLVGDCLALMAALDACSVDAIVTDPPYGLGFMGKAWDHGVPGPLFWAEALRVAKPGAHLVAFGGSRTFHRLACAIEDAGWELRDCLSWLYGSGFPKSGDVSKAIDKAHRLGEGGEYEFRPRTGPTEDVYAVTAFIRAARDRAGKHNSDIDQAFGFNGMAGHWTSSKSQPAVPSWPQWEQLKALLGFGGELDDLVVTLNGGKGDRSLEGTAFVAREALTVEHAPDLLHPEGRVVAHVVRGKDAVEGELYAPGEGGYLPKDYTLTAAATEQARRWAGWGTSLKPGWEPIILARRPLVGSVAANVQAYRTGALNVDGCRIAGAKGDGVWGTSNAGTRPGFNGSPDQAEYRSEQHPGGRWPANVVLDAEAAALLDEETGDASRFYYCAKASRAERDEGLGQNSNTHPTVKPVALMRWCCRLVTPPGGLVLDPFLGSGSTGVAALLEGFQFVGMDQEPEYAEIARRRLAHVRAQPSLWEPE